MGGWWDRKGENEIDLVCEDEFANTLDFYEVKRDARKIDLGALQQKVQAFLIKHPEKADRQRACKGLSLKDML